MARKLIVGIALLALGVAAAVAVHRSNDVQNFGAGAKPLAAPIAPVAVLGQVVATQAGVGAVQGGAVQPGPMVTANDTEAATHQWDELRTRVRQLDSHDQTGLTDLYAQARTAIRAQETAMSKALAQSIPVLVNATLEESFFTVSAWIRSSNHPTDVLQALMNYDPPADAPSSDLHHVAQTPAVRYERLEAYGLKELRSELILGNITLTAEAQKTLIESLVPRATREQSLNLALEMFQLLAALKAQAGIQTALAGHSERDQQIIQAVLSAR